MFARPLRVTLALFCAGWLAGPATAFADEDRPSNQTLVLTGMAIGLPTYMLGVLFHEGSHALAGKLVGVKVTKLSVIPGRHPKTGVFYFGYTQIAGRLTKKQKTFFLIAPKLTDSLLLGSYALAVGLDAMPQNHYGKLTLAVLATGFWVDFSKDILSFAETNDTVRLYSMYDYKNEWQRIPWRLLHAGLSIAAAYSIARGYEGVFERASHRVPAFVVPLGAASF